MLTRELIVRHIGPQGVLHVRGLHLNQTQVPPGIRVHLDTDDELAPLAGDLIVVRVPVGPEMRENIDPDLPLGATVALLLEVEVSELPVGRVLAALAVAKLQVVEAAVVSGTSVATVVVVATRNDELVVPQPYLAHQLEPGNLDGQAVLRRVLGEHALEGLVQRARERAHRVAEGEVEARIGMAASQLEQLQKANDSLAHDLDTAARKLQSVRSSTSYRAASRLARTARLPRRIVHRLGRVMARG
jgi:hypothetical protein